MKYLDHGWYVGPALRSLEHLRYLWRGVEISWPPSISLTQRWDILITVDISRPALISLAWRWDLWPSIEISRPVLRSLARHRALWPCLKIFSSGLIYLAQRWDFWPTIEITGLALRSLDHRWDLWPTIEISGPALRSLAQRWDLLTTVDIYGPALRSLSVPGQSNCEVARNAPFPSIIVFMFRYFSAPVCPPPTTYIHVGSTHRTRTAKKVTFSLLSSELAPPPLLRQSDKDYAFHLS